MAKYGPVIFHVVVILCLICGIYDVMKNFFEHCECEMSYMYELPQYKKVPIPEQVSAQFPSYGLYLYGEGQYHRAVSDLKLQGIPVLYIPGNVGSMKQCRSVASVLLRKAQARQWNPHFNVFTVDFNEEYAALYGLFLRSQIQFVKHSITAILELYGELAQSERPKSVVIVAHSMGGIVARGIFTLSDFDSSTVNSVYTVATPHLHPVINLDSQIANAYNDINTYWDQNAEKLSDVTFISVSGGNRDFQVHGAVARAPSLVNKSVTVATTMMPRAWISADHQCAIWCKQVVLVLTRAMFDMTDAGTRQISEDVGFRSKIARHHFVSNSGLDPSRLGKESKVKLISSYRINYIDDMQWTSSSRISDEGSAYYFLDLQSIIREGKSHVIVRSNMGINNWILGCGSRNCDSAIDLSELSYLTPEFKVAELDITDLINRQISHLILKVPKLSKHLGNVDFNAISKRDALVEIPVPHIFSNLWPSNQGFTANNVVGLVEGVFYHEINLKGLQSIYHAYTLSLKPSNVSGKIGNPLIALKLPSHAPMSYSNTSELQVKLFFTSGNENPTVYIYTDGKTEYSVTIKPDFIGVLGQIIRYQWPVLPSMLTFNIMLALSYQLKVCVSGQDSLSTAAAHEISAKPYKLQPFINLVKALYAYNWFSVAWHSAGLPIPDANRIDVYGTWFSLMPLVTFLFAAEIFSIILLSLSHSVRIGAKLCTWIVKPTLYIDSQPMFLTSSIHAVILSGLVTLSSGCALSYIVAVNFVDLCVLSAKSTISGKIHHKANDHKTKDTDEKLDESSSNISTEASGKDGNQLSEDNATVCSLVNSVYNIKLSMQLIWMVLAAVSFPSVVAWIKGNNLSREDMWLPLGILSSLLFVLHRQQHAVPTPSTQHRIMSKFLYPLTVIASIVCLHSLYRLPYFLLAFVSVYVGMQYFG